MEAQKNNFTGPMYAFDQVANTKEFQEKLDRITRVKGDPTVHL